MRATQEHRRQALEALDRANVIRTKGRKLKARIADGKLTVRKALNHKDAQALPLNRLLEAQWRWGPEKTHKLVCRRLGLSAGWKTARVRDLTKRQKDLIAEGVENPQLWLLDPAFIVREDEDGVLRRR